MKKLTIVGILILVVILVLAFPVSAKQPMVAVGTWDNIVDHGDYFTYDLHGDFDGIAMQYPKPGRAEKGVFIGELGDYVGSCTFNIVIIGEVGNTFKVSGHITIQQCTGDLEGLHAWGVQSVNLVPGPLSGSYTFKYHLDG